MEGQPHSGAGSARNPWKTGVLSVLALLLVGGIVTGAVLAIGSGNEAEGQVIEFQRADEVGDDPFTPATDVTGDTEVELASSASGNGGGGASGEPSSGAGTFGGTGSNRVCDREKLIRELLARPDRMRAWAEVLGVDPTPSAVKRYVRSLRPVTLTRDTQVTNHAYRNGRIVAFQSILEAGTAVLVDKFGKPVVRCRCGNPLLEPVYYDKATCRGCPPDYRYPPPCKWRPYDPYSKLYPRDPYTGKYLEEPPTFVDYEGKNPYSTCYIFYPNPPGTYFTPRKRPEPQPPPPSYTPPPPPSYVPPRTHYDPCAEDPHAPGCQEAPEHEEQTHTDGYTNVYP